MITIYTIRGCGWCGRAKQLLNARGVVFRAIDVTDDQPTRDWLLRRTGKKTVPQIFKDDQLIGGFDALVDYDRTGRLDRA